MKQGFLDSDYNKYLLHRNLFVLAIFLLVIAGNNPWYFNQYRLENYTTEVINTAGKGNIIYCLLSKGSNDHYDEQIYQEEATSFITV